MIAAVHKQALGAAAELIMACHYRLATAQARIGLPDVVLGLTPCGGASQRLPRLVGVDPALQMLLSGHSVEGPAAQVIGLVDGLVDGDLLSGAVTFAQSLLQQGKGPRPTLASRSKLADGRKVAASISAARKSLETNPEHAPDRIVDCVEAAAILPTLAGQAFELDAFARCFEHPQSAALLHVYKAEREIDEALLEREGQAFNPVAPMGMAAVQRLKNALLAAADDLSRNGHSETEIDAACVAYGFRVGPFGGQPAPQANPDVMRRLIAALVAEGAICAEQGAVQRVRDIDALAVHGMGYPRRMGGPMRAAQTLGLLALRNDMRGWAEDSEIWAVPQLLDDAVKIAAGFDGL